MKDIFTPDQRKVFDFPVKREPIVNSMRKDTGFDNIFRTDSGGNLGVVSRDYKMVSHKVAIMDVLRSFEENGLPQVEPVRIAASAQGGRLFAEFKFLDENYDLGIKTTEDRKVGDILAPGFKIFNSYDRSLKYSLSAFFLRLECTNGMTTTENLFHDSQRHIPKLEIGKMVDGFIERKAGLGVTKKVDGLAVGDRIVVVPIGKSYLIGPFQPEIYNTSQGKTFIDLSADTGVILGVFSF